MCNNMKYFFPHHFTIYNYKYDCIKQKFTRFILSAIKNKIFLSNTLKASTNAFYIKITCSEDFLCVQIHSCNAVSGCSSPWWSGLQGLKRWHSKNGSGHEENPRKTHNLYIFVVYINLYNCSLFLVIRSQYAISWAETLKAQ